MMRQLQEVCWACAFTGFVAAVFFCSSWDLVESRAFFQPLTALFAYPTVAS